MSTAISDKVDVKSISFNNTSLINNSSSWKVVKGTASFSDIITLGSGSEISLYIDCTDKSIIAEYIKLLAHLSCDDTTLTTDNVHNVSVTYTIEYENSDNDKTSTDIIVDAYYPKYDFELNYDSDFVVIEVPSNKILGIQVSIINNEDIDIKINNTGLYVSNIINEQTVQAVVQDTVDRTIGEEYLKRLSCIDVLDVSPDINSVPNGLNADYCYMWILRSDLQ